MPRDSGGVYTLPSGNPVVSGTVIAANWANPTMDDVGTALTDSLSRTGNGGMQAAFKNIDGAETSPSDTFNNDPLTGRYLFAVNDMRDTVNGVDQVRYTPEGLSVADGEGGWIPVLGSGSGQVINQEDITDVAGETVFTTTAAATAIEVLINGSLLAKADYTFTLGNTVTLAEPVKSELDVVTLVAFGAFEVADPEGTRELIDVYSKAQVDNGRRNYLINGGFDQWQRGDSFINPSNVYLADRWLYARSGSGESSFTKTTNTFTDPTLPDSVNFFLDWQLTTGTLGTQQIEQKIEGVNTLAGETATISFLARSDDSYVIDQLALNQRFGDGGSPNNVPIIATNIPLTTSWVKYSFQVDVPSIQGKTVGPDNALGVLIQACADAVPDAGQVQLANVQLESGSVATPFEYQSPQQVLADCQRYYQVGGEFYCAPISADPASTTRRSTLIFQTTMRAVPDFNGVAVDGAFNGSTPTETSVRVDMSSNIATSSARLSSWTADAEL